MRISSIFSCSLLLSSSFAATATSSPAPKTTSTYLQYAIKASQTMITDFFDSSKKGFGGLDWGSAVTLTALISLQRQTPNATTPTVLDIIEDMYANPVTKGWIDGFYDDQGWWTLAWLSAYTLTGQSKYLTTAESIFANTVGGWNPHCGGIWENKSELHESAIANVLFLESAAKLAMYTSSSSAKATYLSWAEKEWLWFSTSGLIPQGGGIVAQGYSNATCSLPGPASQDLGDTYTQGVAIHALLSYALVAPSKYKSALTGNATAIAQGTLASPHYNINGTLHEPVGPNWTSDTAEWKGIFFLNLQYLQDKFPSSAYVDFATHNADVLWNTARLGNGTFAPNWSNNIDDFSRKVQAAAMSSAISGLIGIAAIAGAATS